MGHRETIEIGSSPHAEECAQAGTENYEERGRAECSAFVRQLRRHAVASGRELPAGLRIWTKSNSHDFGTYFEVAASFDSDDEAAADAAYWLEANAPANWDAEARAELTDELGLA